MKILFLAIALVLLYPSCSSRAEGTSSDALSVVTPRDGLPNVFAALRAKKPVTIAYFGGSITAGAGASNGELTSYRARVGQWFKSSFPASQITNVNAAIGGTGSDLGAFRLTRDVLDSKPDLVFVEFAVNDTGRETEMIHRTMEGIVRHIRRSNPYTDICFIYTFVVGQLADFKQGKLIDAAQADELIAEQYHIPAVNVAVPAAKRLIDGSLTNDQFSKDGVHPNDVGYQIYTDAIVEMLSAQEKLRANRHKYKLTAALHKDNIDNGELNPATAPADTRTGWQLTDKSPVGDFKSVLASDTSGAVTSVGFKGQILGIFYALGPDTGAFDYKIDSGEWKTLDPYDVYSKQYFRPSYHILADGLAPGDHTVSIRVAAMHNPESKGNWTRIGYFMTNPPL